MEQVNEWRKSSGRDYGRGWAGGKLVTEVAASVVNDMLQQHLWTTFNVAQAFVPALVANG